jgi:hypothetical protein
LTEQTTDRKKRRARRQQPEPLVRQIEVRDVSFDVSLDATGTRRAAQRFDSDVNIEFTGVMNEAVSDIRDVKVLVYPVNPSVAKSSVRWIGLALVNTPTLHPTVPLSYLDFERVWALALSGRLAYIRLVMMPPRYRQAHVISISFSTHSDV